MIRYRAGYKYGLAESYHRHIDISGMVCGITEDVVTEYILLSVAGDLTVVRGYAWDGATGAPDSDEIMEASLVHDAGFQLLRERKLPMIYLDKFNNLLKEICLEKGMEHVYAQGVFSVVDKLGAHFADPASAKPVITLP